MDLLPAALLRRFAPHGLRCVGFCTADELAIYDLCNLLLADGRGTTFGALRVGESLRLRVNRLLRAHDHVLGQVLTRHGVLALLLGR